MYSYLKTKMLDLALPLKGIKHFLPFPPRLPKRLVRPQSGRAVQAGFRVGAKTLPAGRQEGRK